MIIANTYRGSVRKTKPKRSAWPVRHSQLVVLRSAGDAAHLRRVGRRRGLARGQPHCDQAGITRSVIVNALRKLASANVIESRSLGMKGTYLRILNPEIRKELERQRYPYPNTDLLKRQEA